MSVVTKKIGKGISFHYVYCDKFKSNSYTAHFIAPLALETAALYALLPQVLERGSASYPTKALISKRLETLYSADFSCRASRNGEHQDIIFSLEALDDRFSYDGTEIFREGCALLSSILFQPLVADGAFSEDYVEGEKKLLCDAIKARINNKTAYALTRCKEIMCEGEPYGISELGTEETVQVITPSSLYEAYLRLLREAQIEIFFVGNKPYDEILAITEEIFGRITDRAPVCATVERGSCKTVRSVCEPVSAVQGKLTLGFRMKEKAPEGVLPLFHAIYSGSPASKLFMNVREKLSLCYYCQATADNQKGVMFVYSGIENQNAEKAKEEILHQLAEIANGNITEEELHCAKQYTLNNLRSIDDSAYSIENWYLRCILLDSLCEPEDRARAVEALTAKDVAEFAKCISLDTVYLMKGTMKEEGEG